MVFVTDFTYLGEFRLLSGLLLDFVTPAAYRSDIFNAVLVSDSVREMVCEKVQVYGGHGTTHDGQFVGTLESELGGEMEYVYARPSSATIFGEIAENRIQIITKGRVEEAILPAFLTFVDVLPPIETRAVVTLEIASLEESPDVQAFAARNPHILDAPEIKSPMREGMLLPVSGVAQGRSFQGVLKIQQRLDKNKFMASIYHEANEVVLSCGDVLERIVKRPNPTLDEKLLSFSAKIAVIESVEGRIN